MSQSNGRVENEFAFEIPAPFNVAAPLFGPEGERAWAKDAWNPVFVYPLPPRDIQGAIFTIERGHSRSTWVNTLFDLENGRMQYIYFIPETMVTQIDVRLTSVHEDRTRVNVTYTRTALSESTWAEVQAMGKQDCVAGEEWQKAIGDYLSAEC